MADSSVAITAGSGTPIRVLTGLGAGSADQQVMTLADSAGNLLGTAAAPLPAASLDSTLGPTNLAALNAAATINLNGHGTVIVQLTGTYSGTATFQGLMPDGTWVAVNAFNAFDGNKIAAFYGGTGQARALVSGYQAFRVIMTAYTSGTAVVSLQASYATVGYPAAAVITEGNTYADSTTGVTILARTVGSGATAVNRVPVVDNSNRLLVVNTPDTNRTGFALAGIAAAGVTVEALLSTIAQRNGTAAGAATTQTVTAGKTLRITNITASMRLGAAAAGWTRFVLRSTYSATTVTASSPAIWAAEIGPGAAAVSASTATMTYDFPDGIELPAGASFGISHISSATTNVETITVTGFEYS